MGLVDSVLNAFKSKERLQQEQNAVDKIAEVAGIESTELLKYLPASLIHDHVRTLEGICGKVGVDSRTGISRILDGLSKNKKLLRKNPKGLVALVNKYREHTWGLLDAFGNNAVKIEKKKKYRKIIQAVKDNADDDVGYAFSYLKVPMMRKCGDLLIHATYSAGENTSDMVYRINKFFEGEKYRRNSKRIRRGVLGAILSLAALVGLSYSYSDGFTLSDRATWKAFTDDVSAISHEVRDIGETVGPRLMALVGKESSSDPSSSAYVTSTPEGNAGINATIEAYGRFEFKPGERPNAPEKRYGLEFYEDGELVSSSFSVEDDCKETYSSDWNTVFECQQGEVEFLTFEYDDYDLFSIETTFPVKYTRPGEHTYFARVFDRKHTLDSDIETVTFTGETMDLPPTFSTFSFCDKEDEENGHCNESDLQIIVNDIGDNSDLERVLVYLNDNELDSISTDETCNETTDCFDVVYVDTSTLDLEQGDVFTAVVYDGAGQEGKSGPLEVTVASKAPTTEEAVDERENDDTPNLEEKAGDDDATVEPEPVETRPYKADAPPLVTADMLETTPAETGIFNGYEPGFDFVKKPTQEYKDGISAYARNTFFVEKGRVNNALEADEADVFFRRGAGDTTMSAYFYCTGPEGNPKKEKIIFSFTDTESGHRFDYHVFQDGRTREIITDQDGNRSTESDANTTNQHLAAIFQYFVNSGEVLDNVPIHAEAPTPVE
jgi:hypothetical protein